MSTHSPDFDDYESVEDWMNVYLSGEQSTPIISTTPTESAPYIEKLDWFDCLIENAYLSLMAISVSTAGVIADDQSRPEQLEEWRPAHEYPEYEVSTLGRIKGKKEQLMTVSTVKGQYSYVMLSPRYYKPVRLLVSRLIAKTFLTPPSNLHVQVDHINRDISDNRVCNLRWCTASDNVRNRGDFQSRGHSRCIDQLALNGTLIKTWGSATEAAKQIPFPRKTIVECLGGRVANPNRFRWKYHVDADLPGEIWVNTMYNNTGPLTVSNQGRVDSNGLKTYGHLEKGYMMFRGCSVHRLVATAFIPNTYDLEVVNHIDGDKTNNVTENLEWCTRSQNSQHAIDTGLTPITRPIHQLDSCGNIINVFQSIASAGRIMDISASCIGDVCRGKGHTAGGFHWKFASG